MAGLLKYRADIDGLRAIAVTVVVACHAGVPGFGGGFVGVDVFFVISGFLITGLLVAEHEQQGRIRLADFYARRVRRLVPALCVVLAATLAVAPFILLANGELQQLSASVLSVVGFVSNVFFHSAQLGYFGNRSDVLPLLHTWSLAVEEQFYLLWPPALIGLLVFARRRGLGRDRVLLATLVAGVAVSLALCLLLGQSRQNVVFFLTPFRAWELGIGALLIFVPVMAGRAATITGIVGLALIAAAAMLFEYDTVFIGAAAVTAVAGAAAVMAAGTDPASWVSRLLASRPFTAIGKVSYAWYLWHWPMLALARTEALGQRSLPRDAALALAALLLAAITWRLVEQPVRQRRPGPFARTPSTIAAGVVMLGACALLAGAIWVWAERYAPRSEAATAAALARGDIYAMPGRCNGDDVLIVRPPPAADCVQGSRRADVSILVWGDSHARHFMPAFTRAAETLDVAVIPAIRAGCRPFLSLYRDAPNMWPDRRRRCTLFSRSVVEWAPELRREHGLAGVVIAAWWNAEDGSITDMAATVATFRAQGLRVLLVAGVPEYAYDVTRCIERRGPTACDQSRQAVDTARAAQVAALRRLARDDPGVMVWDPVAIMCSSQVCSPVADGRVLYSDTAHLTQGAALGMADDIAPAVAWLAGRER